MASKKAPKIARAPAQEKDLFADSAPDNSAVTQNTPLPPQDATQASTTSLQVLPAGAAALLSPAAKAYNRELARIDKLKAQIVKIDAMGTAYQADENRLLNPLRERQKQHMRELALLLAPHIDDKKLSKAQRATAHEIVCTMAAMLAVEGDAEMAELHDQHSPQTLEQKNEDARVQLRKMMGNILGEDMLPPEDETAGVASTPEEELARLLAQAQARIHQKQGQEREAKQAREAQRKSKRTPSAAQRKAEQAQQDAETTLRTLFRQLASALHPDREPDEQERRRKTELMSQANAAYQRKDLVALMNIQLAAELVDPTHVAQLPEKRLAALTHLLKQQVTDLERERYARQQRWMHELDWPWGRSFTEAGLRRQLAEELQDLHDQLRLIEYDLDVVRTGKQLKSWLNRQHRLAQQDELDDDFFFD